MIMCKCVFVVCGVCLSALWVVVLLLMLLWWMCAFFVWQCEKRCVKCVCVYVVGVVLCGVRRVCLVVVCVAWVRGSMRGGVMHSIHVLCDVRCVCTVGVARVVRVVCGACCGVCVSAPRVVCVVCHAYDVVRVRVSCGP